MLCRSYYRMIYCLRIVNNTEETELLLKVHTESQSQYWSKKEKITIRLFSHIAQLYSEPKIVSICKPKLDSWLISENTA